MTDSAPNPGTGDPLDLRGVVPPTVTAFDDDGAVDHDATAAHARFVVDGGARAVFPLGTNGEFPLLTGDERRAVVETVVDAVDVPVIAGVGAESTRETVANAEHAAATGADGVVVVTPYYYPLDGDAAVEHYRAVAEAVDVPVYVYHIPSKTGNELSLATLGRLATLDGVAGVKDSSKDVPWLAQAIDAHPELTFLAGSDSLLFTGLAVGCAGMVSAVANVFPELVVDLYDAYDAGRESEARRLQSRVFAVRSALKRGPYMAGVKTALSLRDLEFDVGGLRAPLRTMDDDERAALRSELRELDVL
ncbi:dihydrodipicolinate synthase family protein [Haloplanus rallus]|jgi:4-hydroxy-tetrahydrodipicolinate synthase/2-dehydro-3-deoxy-phosphogluconate/2-dehydro-3-deoxy-6-phosphogalactonate aldolase|uniref:Dihydrodipicolinate synthase family protein n=1 Tax=Haloplanus rallus TaxID=1816183 RepID=A0A6B9F8L7_9EURY|nr:dihydrodipicolinate synthase family protein [Haloplanus rallus]QGX94767.1 dihydrodipicolinate synthase family protein [Haloplanus rallus]